MSSAISFASRLLARTLAMAIVLSFHHCSFIQACRNGSEPEIISDTKDLVSGTKHIGRIRYHYVDECVGENTAKPCSDILLMGVGAAMSVENYDIIARTIVSKAGSSLIVVIADSNPGNIVKFSPTKYASLANFVDMQHRELIPVCGNETANLLIGGHSASGQAALDAAQKGLYDFVPSGFVGLDPYDTSKIDANLLQLPTLDWGFAHTTCHVQIDKAAKGAYKLSSAEIGRVLYSIDNKHKGDDKDDDDMTHCVFTDNGCRVGGFDVCPTIGSHEWVYESVAESIQLFVNALGSNFTKEMFGLPSTRSGQVSLFVNNDDVDRRGKTDGDNFPGHSKHGSFAVSTNTQLTLALMIVIAAAMVTVSRHQEWLQQWGLMDTPNYGDIFQPLLLR
eukprot:CAMPEP_0116092348 /NCGR_PEP_ID=MMETSP0327-20121206/7998_1 /TAXON_ID=44447 /ORGANISM="Pseudo-nitzschia delicatissima, Strain B596" /LENGTH=391 /DNA_ID=CAMNT_0003583775 /DNA_START=150 /DNA_END=1325 /DNA_ORIENTATION=+